MILPEVNLFKHRQSTRGESHLTVLILCLVEMVIGWETSDKMGVGEWAKAVGRWGKDHASSFCMKL